jgi:hypothetical protein
MGITISNNLTRLKMTLRNPDTNEILLLFMLDPDVHEINANQEA